MDLKGVFSCITQMNWPKRQHCGRLALKYSPQMTFHWLQLLQSVTMWSQYCPNDQAQRSLDPQKLEFSDFMHPIVTDFPCTFHSDATDTVLHLPLLIMFLLIRTPGTNCNAHIGAVCKTVIIHPQGKHGSIHSALVDREGFLHVLSWDQRVFIGFERHWAGVIRCTYW